MSELIPLSIGLIGAPVEAGAGTRGCIMGPAALRTARLPEMLASLGHDVKDFGDIAIPAPVPGCLVQAAGTAFAARNADLLAGWTGAIHDATLAVLEEGRIPIVLGGDHSLSMGSVSAVARHCAARGREPVVLWLDAHADFNTPATSPSGNLHGMSVAMICGEPSLTPLLGARPHVPVPHRDVTLFGLRSIDSGERRAVLTAGIAVEDMRRIDEHGVAALVRGFLKSLSGRDVHLHVSLDVDFLDPSIAPGVGTAVPGGATWREGHLVMEMLQDSGLVGSMDLVELNPFLDERGRSAVALTDMCASLFGKTVIER